jgi:hypothetical protein
LAGIGTSGIASLALNLQTHIQLQIVAMQKSNRVFLLPTDHFSNFAFKNKI